MQYSLRGYNPLSKHQLANMQAKGYEIKQGKYLASKGIDDNSFMRIKSLGTAYSEQAVRTRIDNYEKIFNTKIHIYDDKAVKMSYRKRLRMNIDKALKSVDNFDDFLALMRSWNYEIKQGKHLAQKLRDEIAEGKIRITKV